MRLAPAFRFSFRLLLNTGCGQQFRFWDTVSNVVEVNEFLRYSVQLCFDLVAGLIIAMKVDETLRVKRFIGLQADKAPTWVRSHHLQHFFGLVDHSLSKGVLGLKVVPGRFTRLLETLGVNLYQDPFL